ncbi:helix-turn-helix domain-containing protein [Streptomyces sp. NPDC058291]|jgi:IS30 family transposase
MGEREEISRGLCAGASYRAVVDRLDRAASTIAIGAARPLR